MYPQPPGEAGVRAAAVLIGHDVSQVSSQHHHKRAQCSLDYCASKMRLAKALHYSFTFQ